VTHQAQILAITGFQASFVRQRQIVALADQRGRSAMLESAVTVADRHGHEDITIERRRLAKEADLVFADFFEIALEALEVSRVTARDHDLVRHAAGFETHFGEIADFDRVVDQLVVIGCFIHAKAAFIHLVRLHARRELPVFGEIRLDDFDASKLVFLPGHRQKHRWAIEKSAGLIKVSAAHRQIESVDLVMHRHSAIYRRNLPAMFVEFGDGDFAALSVFGADAHDMAGEFTDQITAGYPHR